MSTGRAVDGCIADRGMASRGLLSVRFFPWKEVAVGTEGENPRASDAGDVDAQVIATAIAKHSHRPFARVPGG